MKPVRSELHRAIAATLPWIVRRSLRRGLAGVYLRGDFGTALRPGTLLAPNHHSWWDAYLVWYLAHRAKLPLAALMDELQLARFPFFRYQGVIDRRRPRALVRRLRAGALGVVFPEGEMRPPGPPGPLAPGAVRLARSAQAPLRVVAIRVAVRGAERPEALISFGREVTDHDALARGLKDELEEIDRLIREAPPERPIEGFSRVLKGSDSADRVAGRFGSLWKGSP